MVAFVETERVSTIQIRVGYELIYECPQPTPMVLMLNIHHTRADDIVVPDRMTVRAVRPDDVLPGWLWQLVHARLVAPAGRAATVRQCASSTTRASPTRSRYRAPAACRSRIFPTSRLVFLLGSRYCETDRLTGIAWNLFGGTPPGGARVQAICDYVHHHITFNYQDARPTRTAWEAFEERRGVCRDFAHLAIAFCRCMNIPARYCTGYLGDIGIPPPYGVPWILPPGSRPISAGAGTPSIARNNVPRIGRVLIARGRDATDVAISNTFGPNTLAGFKVWTDEVERALREGRIR